MIKITRNGIMCSLAKIMNRKAKINEPKNLSMVTIKNLLENFAVFRLCDLIRILNTIMLTR
jgi:hypothetical protein